MIILNGDGYPIVIEFRHKSWVKDSVFGGLEKRKTSVAFCSMPKKACFIGPLAYMRLHESNDLYLPVIQDAHKMGKKVFVFFNNQLDTSCIWNAQKLKNLQM